MTKHPLFTAGYAGFDSATFLWKLRFDNIEVVVDVRDNPVSRNRAFTQSVFKEVLEQNGIRYVHAERLGVPAFLRHELRAGGNLVDYFEAYREYLRREDSAIAALLPMLLEKRCCLVCLEKNYAECHRSVLAEQIANTDTNIEVRHI